MNKIGYYEFAGTVYDFCKKVKIKVDEPYNKNTKRYDKFILYIDTFEKAFAFSNKYLKLFKTIKPEIDHR